jgi:hypothetical protein
VRARIQLHKQGAKLHAPKAPLSPEAPLASVAPSAAPVAPVAIDRFDAVIQMPSESIQLNLVEDVAEKQNDGKSSEFEAFNYSEPH